MQDNDSAAGIIVRANALQTSDADWLRIFDYIRNL